MNNNEFATRFNAVRNQVRTQLGYIEQAWGVPNLQAWWDVFTEDYFSQIEEWAQSWADQAIVAAAAPYLAARNQGRNPQTYAQVINTLQQWQQLLATRLRFPPYTGFIPLPQPPGSGGSAGGSSAGGSAGGSSPGGSAGGSSPGGSAGGSSPGGSAGGSPGGSP